MSARQIVSFIGIMIAQQSFGQTTLVDSSRCFTPSQEKQIIKDLILFEGCQKEVASLEQIVSEQKKLSKTQDSLVIACSKQLDACNSQVAEKIKQVSKLQGENEELKNTIERKKGVVRALSYVCGILVAITGTAAYFAL